MTRRVFHPTPLAVRVTSDARERLAERAREQGVDVSDVVRTAIDEYLSPQPEWEAGEIPVDQELRSSYSVVLTPEFLKEVSEPGRRMGYQLGELMRRGARHLVAEHMPETCGACGGRKEDPQTYCASWGHGIRCMHRFHFDDSAEWERAVGAGAARASA